MASVESRVVSLIEEHLGVTDSAILDGELSAFGVNSMDAVGFMKAVSKEFGVDIPPEVARGFGSMRELIAHLEG